LRRPRARSLRPRGPARRTSARAHANRVPAARTADEPSPPGAHALDDLRSRVGLRLRAHIQLAGGLRQLPAAQDRGGWRAASPAHSPRGRLRAPLRRAMSFRRGTVLLSAGAVATAVVVASAVVYVVTRDDLRGQVDASLRAKLNPGRPEEGAVEAADIAR